MSQQENTIPQGLPTRIKIKQHLIAIGTTSWWLGKQLGISDRYIYELLSGRDRISPKMLDRINKVLNTKFQSNTQSKIPEMSLTKMAKNKPSKELYWKDLVEVFFIFCREKFGESPSFDGGAPRSLKAIVDSMRKKADEAAMAWTPELATRMLRTFLDFAYCDNWLRQNFVLSVLNSRKDQVFFRIAQSKSNPTNHYLDAVEKAKRDFKPIEAA